MNSARILIVEDEALVAADLKDYLINLGHRVVGAAATGHDAVRIAAATLPDLVLMDVMLSGPLDGIATARRLRSDLDIPVIYLTAFCDDALIEKAKLTEPLGYILKPFDEHNLRITIELGYHRHKVEQTRTRLESELQTALGKVKTLRGLLPICAGCKKIRDAEGMWTPIESYLSERTDVSFSHGLCPVCVEKYSH